MARVAQEKAEMGIYTYGKLTERPPVPCYIIDVGGLRDPMSNRGFRHKYQDGRAEEVQQYIKEDPRVDAILDTIRMLAFMHLRSSGKDNKWLSFGLRDHHGVWIAPAIGELAAAGMDRAGYSVNLCHYHLENAR